MKPENEKLAEENQPTRKLSLSSRKLRSITLITGAFLLGIAVGVLIFSLIKTSPATGIPVVNLLGGTMLSSDNTPEWTTNSTLQLQGPQFRGTCQSRYSTNLVEIYLNISSDEPVQTILEYDPADFSLEMVVNIEADAGTSVSSGEGKIDIRSAGANRLAIRLTNKNSNPHNLLLQVVQGGMQAAQNTIPVNQTR